MSDDLDDRRDVEIKKIHSKMVENLFNHIHPDLPKNWTLLKNALKPFMDPLSISGERVKSMVELCENMMAKGVIELGRYDILYNIVETIDPKAAEYIEKASKDIAVLRLAGMPDRLSAQVEWPLLEDINISTEQKDLCRKQVADNCQISEKRVKVEQEKGILRISFVISGTASRLESSALRLAEKIKSDVKRGKIVLKDSSNVPLPISQEGSTISSLSENFSGKPKVSISKGRMMVYRKTNLIIECSIASPCAITSVRWMRFLQGKRYPIPENTCKYTGGSVQSPSLHISDVTRKDEGTYMCVAENINGVGESNETFLQVLDSRRARRNYNGDPPPLGDREVLKVKEGDLIDIGCSSGLEWWQGSIGKSKGWFPANVVKETQDGINVLDKPIDVGIYLTRLIDMYDWQVGIMTKDEAEKHLMHKENGTFLIGLSCYTYEPFLAVKYGNGVIQTKVEITEKSKRFSIEDETFFINLHDLVEHYKKVSLMNTELRAQTKLVYPIKSE